MRYQATEAVCALRNPVQPHQYYYESLIPQQSDQLLLQQHQQQTQQSQQMQPQQTQPELELQQQQHEQQQQQQQQLQSQQQQPCNSPVINRRKYERVQQWNAEHHRVSHIRQGYGSLSRTSSVASGMSGISRISNISQFSALSISTQMTDLPNPAQMQRSNQYSSASSTASYAENIDPTCSRYFLSVEQTVDEVTGKIQESLRSRNFCGDYNEEILKRLSRKVYTLVNQYDLTRLSHEKLKFFLTSILILIDAAPDDQEVKRALLASIYVFSTKPFISRILKEVFLENPERVILIFAKRFNCQFVKFDFCNYAAVILHTFLLYANERKFRLDLSKKIEIVNQVLGMLCAFAKPKLDHRLGERSKRIIIDISRVIVFGDDALKKYFAENGGIETLLWFLLNEPSEEVMYYAAHSLRHMLHSAHKVIAERCVAARGVQIFADKLSHGSPRLLVECSDCLSAMSDVDCLRENEMSRPLWQVLQILGSNEPELMKHSLAFLGNVVSSNRSGITNPNKEFLISNRGVESIINVLRYYIPRQDSPLITYEIIENGIFALKNLTSAFGLEMKRDFARKQLVEIDGALNVLLEHLLAPVCLEQRNRIQFQIFDIQLDNRNDLLRIIQRLMESSLVDKLFECHLSSNNSFVDVLMAVLLQSAGFKESCAYDQQRNKLTKTVETVILILDRLVTSPKFCAQFLPLIKESKISNIMRSATSIELSYAVLRVIEISVRDPIIRDECRQDSGLVEIIQFYLNHQQVEFSNIARKILSTIQGDAYLEFPEMVEDDIEMSFE
uniref:Armadillo repeat-containing protein 8 n=1 Tax=Syphacia muris TaxID=451379 RepID=A0A0N5ASD5_9BILA